MFRIFLFFLFITSINSFFSQKIIKKEFLAENYTAVDSASAFYVRVLYVDKGYQSYEVTKKINGELISEVHYADLEGKVREGESRNYNGDKLKTIYTYKNGSLNGLFILFHENDTLKAKGFYKAGLLDSNLVSYYRTGIQKRKDYYQKGELVEGKCFSSSGLDTAYFEFETDPKFIGDSDNVGSWIAENVRYPEEAIEYGIQGKIVIGFVVDTLGNITEVKVVRGKDPYLVKESIRVMELMPQWKPGTLDGELVKVKYTLPINFRLDDGDYYNEIDTSALLYNIYWKKGSELVDPFSEKSIKPKSRKGHNIYTVYFKKDHVYSGVITFETYKKKVSETELEYLNEVKFGSKKHLKKYFRTHSYPANL